jgi:hypothetical protein
VQGPAGGNVVERRHRANAVNSLSVNCPTGYLAVGGGGKTLDGSAISRSIPFGLPARGWAVKAVHARKPGLVVYVFCLPK